MANEKLPPHDIDAEENLIGSLLIDGEAIHKISDIIQPLDFYAEPNALIYHACIELYKRDDAIDQITVAQELAHANKLDTVGGPAYLSHLISMVPTSLHIEHYAQIVFRLSTMRRLISASRQIEALGYQADPDIDNSLNKAEDVIFRLRQGTSPRGFVHIRQVLDPYLDTVGTNQTDGTAENTRVSSGFRGLDDFTNGFSPSDLIIVAGRPSMGKTSLALNIARNAAMEHGSHIAIFSMEMSRESLGLRLLSSESGINSRNISFGPLTDNERNRVVDTIGKLSEAQIYIDDSPLLRIMEMRSKARRLHFEKGINLIVLDYLQLMQGEHSGGSENRVQEIGYISRSLKALARELNVPVIAVSQLSRASEQRPSHIPQLSDLRESGSIEQDADIVMFIYREEYYSPNEDAWRVEHPGEPYPKEQADIIIAKHRNGPTGQVKLRFHNELAKFENLGSVEELSSLL